MSRKGPEQSTVLLINVGVTEPGAEPNLFLLERIKDVAKRLIEKQIFKNPKDEVAILLMQKADRTRNPGKEYIRVCAPMELPSFEMVNNISSLKSTNDVCNWLYSLYDATEYLMEHGYVPSKNSKYEPLKKIIMMSDFKEDEEVMEISFAMDLLKRLRENKIRLLAVGEENLYDKADDSLTPSEKVLNKVLAKNSGQFLSLNNVMKELLYFKCPQKKQNRWLADLELGSLSIPIAGYIKVKLFDKFPHWERYAKNQKVSISRHYLDRHHNTYTEEERIKGYKWAGVFQAVTDEYLKRLQYEAGSKCYQIYGFTKSTKIGLDLWCDGSTRIILPASENSVKEFYSLVQAMHRNDLIAIVRKVYCRNRTPVMVALYPCVNVPDEPWCLVEVTLPFAENRRMLFKKPIKSIVKSATNEQRKLVEELLNKFTMNISETESEQEPFAFPGTVPNPIIQHCYNMVSHRALNPDKPLPEMEDYLKQALDSPIGQEKINSILPEIKRVFDLTQSIPRRKRKPEDLSQDSAQQLDKAVELVKDEFICKNDTVAPMDDVEESQDLLDLKEPDIDEWDLINE